MSRPSLHFDDAKIERIGERLSIVSDDDLLFGLLGGLAWLRSSIDPDDEGGLNLADAVTLAALEVGSRYAPDATADTIERLSEATSGRGYVGCPPRAGASPGEVCPSSAPLWGVRRGAVRHAEAPRVRISVGHSFGEPRQVADEKERGGWRSLEVLPTLPARAG